MPNVFTQFQKRWIGRPLTAPSGIVAPVKVPGPPLPSASFAAPAYSQDLRHLNGTR